MIPRFFSTALWLVLCASAFALPINSRAQVDFPAIFNHHMVLQRDMPVPVFGTDTPGTTVTVEFAGQTKSTTADASGVWLVNLDPMDASAESRELTVKGSTTLVLEDVLVGEVWMGCGQSNMAITVGGGAGYPKDYPKDKTRPLIRYSPVASDKQRKALLADKAVPHRWNPEWLVCTPENIPKVGGILLAFADELHNELGVPIGIVNRAIGGNPVRSFVDQKNLTDDPIVLARIKELEESYERDLQRAQEQAKAWKEFSSEFPQKKRIEMGFRKAPGLATGRVGMAKLSTKEGLGWQLYIQPMLGFAMRGVVWDQGESGAGMLGNPCGDRILHTRPHARVAKNVAGYSLYCATETQRSRSQLVGQVWRVSRRSRATTCHPAPVRLDQWLQSRRISDCDSGAQNLARQHHGYAA